MNLVTEYLLTPLVTGLIWAIFGLGVFVAYRVLDIADLSVEGVMPLSGVIGLYLINQGWAPLLVIFISILVGAVLGIINGCLQVYLKIPPLLSGIILMISLLSIIIVLSNGIIHIENNTIFTQLEKVFTSMFDNVMWGKWLGCFLILSVIVTLIILGLYFFFGTELGVAIRATGINKKMAKAQGINTSLMIIIALAISSALIALAGGLLAQYDRYMTSVSGSGTIVRALSILFLGEVIFGKRSFKNHLISIVLGGILYWYILDAIFLLPGFDTNYNYLIQGIVLVLVLVIPKYITKLRQKKNRGENNA